MPVVVFANAALVALLLICLVTDVRWKRIPNWATLPSIVLGLGLNSLAGGWTGLKAAGLGLLVGFGGLFVMFVLGWMGGGDVKLMGAIGALKGFPFVVSALIYSILVGGFIGIAVLIWNKRLLRTLKNVFLFLLGRAVPFVPKRELSQEALQPIPFGIAIVVGTIWALVMSHFTDPLWGWM
jgi:prepilin peptidase CpaA